MTTAPGPNTLGIEIVARAGRQRIPISVDIAARDVRPALRRHPRGEARSPEPAVGHPRRPPAPGAPAHGDGRRAARAFTPPVTIVAGLGFGGDQTWLGGSPGRVADRRDLRRGAPRDRLHGAARDRGEAPAAGTVLFAGPFTLAGQTRGDRPRPGRRRASLLHLSRIDVHAGHVVEARAPVGLSGDTGIDPGAARALAAYVHGVAVDPRGSTAGAGLGAAAGLDNAEATARPGGPGRGRGRVDAQAQDHRRRDGQGERRGGSRGAPRRRRPRARACTWRPRPAGSSRPRPRSSARPRSARPT